MTDARDPETYLRAIESKVEMIRWLRDTKPSYWDEVLTTAAQGIQAQAIALLAFADFGGERG